MLGSVRQTTSSLTRWFEITCAVASCVNLREEMLALHAGLPMIKTALVSSLTCASRFLLWDWSTFFSKKTFFS
jgi:hypothetical protein